MSPSRLTLESLQLMDAIARGGSFAAAAAELARVPSAVTYAVRRLEDDLDVLLFDRSGYRARLTPAGEELLEEGRHLLAAVDELAQRVQRIASGWESGLGIALDTVIPFERLVPLIDRFQRAAPTSLKVTHEVLGGTWDALLSGRADLAIGAPQEAPQWSRLSAGHHSEVLGTMELVFALAPTHPLAALPSPLPARALRGQRQVVVADSSQRLAPRTEGLLGMDSTLTVPSMAAKIEAQRAGLGVGFLPLPLIAADLQRGTLVLRTLRQRRLDVVLHTAWRGEARGKAIAWWLARLREPAWRAALTT